MAKKTTKKGKKSTKKEKKEEGSKKIDATLKELEKKFGEGAIMKLGETPDIDVKVISTGSIGLDEALGVGGLPRGRVVEIYGPEASGKTTLALHAVAEAQKEGGIAAFIDAEHALDPIYAKKIGVDTDNLLLSQPNSGEQALDIVESLVRSGNIDVIVIDSVAALTPRDEIEGEMGDHHVGKQARLMSQALRKLTAITNKSKTVVIFINQIRMKIGVMFGCLNYKSAVTLSDGSTEWIGKIVNQKMPVEVLSYDWKKDKIVPAKVIGWYNNGKTESFLQIHAYDPSGNGKAQLSCTPNHPILTPVGYRRAEELKIGDKIMITITHYLSDFQKEVIRGSLMGDGALSFNGGRTESYGVRFRMGHGKKQTNYLKWKAELFKNIKQTIYTNKKGAIFCDMTPLPELYDMRKEVYTNKGKYLSPDFLSALTPLSLAIWYMDDGSLHIRNKAGDKGRIAICVQALHPESRIALKRLLKDRYDINVKLKTVAKKARFTFTQPESEKFLKLIRRSVHPSMDYKLLPKFRNNFSIEPKFSEPTKKPLATPIREIKEKPKTRSMNRFDIQVEGHHNFLADNVIVHNSPETTSGGKALKFYCSVRLDIRRRAQIKKGDEVVGSRAKVKVVKNKVASPFRETEFDIMYGEGISREGEILALGEKYEIITRAGAYYKYDDETLGQGYDNTRQFLLENKKVANEILRKIKKEMKEAV